MPNVNRLHRLAQGTISQSKHLSLFEFIKYSIKANLTYMKLGNLGKRRPGAHQLTTSQTVCYLMLGLAIGGTLGFLMMGKKFQSNQVEINLKTCPAIDIDMDDDPSGVLSFPQVPRTLCWRLGANLILATASIQKTGLQMIWRLRIKVENRSSRSSKTQTPSTRWLPRMARHIKIIR